MAKYQHRFSVQVTDRARASLLRLARLRGISESAVVREILDLTHEGVNAMCDNIEAAQALDEHQREAIRAKLDQAADQALAMSDEVGRIQREAGQTIRDATGTKSARPGKAVGRGTAAPVSRSAKGRSVSVER